MIQGANVDQRERLAQRLGEKLVGTTGLCYTRRVIVGEDHRRGIAGQRGLDDLARVHAGLRKCSAEELLDPEHAILAVEEQSHEHFVRTSAERKSQIIANGLGRDERIALGGLLCQRPPRKLDDTGEARLIHTLRGQGYMLRG